jgi:uncharacterized protein
VAPTPTRGLQSPADPKVAASSPTRLNIDVGVSAVVSPNKKVIETYLTTTDKSKLGPLLADDVEWVEWVDGVPASGAVTRGKEAHLKNYGDDILRGEVHRLTEEGNVVVAEGTAHVTKKDGSSLSVRFVDIFEMENGKIKRKSSFGALIKGPA